MLELLVKSLSYWLWLFKGADGAIHWIATYHMDCITRNHVKKKDHMLR